MTIRERALPYGWYPESESGVKSFIKEHLDTPSPREVLFLAGIVPHAGWAYSGKTAAQVMVEMNRDPDTVIVVGGHLPPGNTVLSAREEGFQVPQGIIENDLELLEKITALCKEENVRITEDIHADNTVEVQLPLVKYFFPKAKVIGFRAAPSRVAAILGEKVREGADSLGRNCILIGSTDLTHYGSNYGFSPKGKGQTALQWVKETNDKRFVDAALEMDILSLLERANSEHSACSAGGAAAAIAFARASGVNEGKLVGYLTSYDVYPAESFVGYAGIGY